MNEGWDDDDDLGLDDVEDIDIGSLQEEEDQYDDEHHDEYEDVQEGHEQDHSMHAVNPMNAFGFGGFTAPPPPPQAAQQGGARPLTGLLGHFSNFIERATQPQDEDYEDYEDADNGDDDDDDDDYQDDEGDGWGDDDDLDDVLEQEEFSEPLNDENNLSTLAVAPPVIAPPVLQVPMSMPTPPPPPPQLLQPPQPPQPPVARPPPPPPAASTHSVSFGGVSTAAITDETVNTGWEETVADGWEDDDVDLDDDATPLVDHTPALDASAASGDAIQADDDISRDDTLSMANSRVRLEEPPLAPNDIAISFPNNATAPNNLNNFFTSSMTLNSIQGNSSIGSLQGSTSNNNNNNNNGSTISNLRSPLVDHTPLPLKHQTSLAPSLQVFSDSEGDLEETNSLHDREDSYGQMVDHTPLPPPASTSNNAAAEAPGAATRTPTVSTLSQTTTPREDDTIFGVAAPQDLAPEEDDEDDEDDVVDPNEADDEVSSRGTTLDDNRSFLSSVRMVIPEDSQWVDHVPSVRAGSRTITDAFSAVANASSGSEAEDNVNDDVIQPFGPIVDQTPIQLPGEDHENVDSAGSAALQNLPHRSVATSVATQYTLPEDDPTVEFNGEEQTEADDDLTLPSVVTNKAAPLQPPQEALVDHVPLLHSTRFTVDGSMRVMHETAEELTQVDTIAEDAAVDFGPIVDHTPFSTRSVGYSAAASMATLHDREELDNITAPGAASDDGWDHDEEEALLNDDEVPPAPPMNKEPTLVDHVPKHHRISARHTDASTVVLVDPQDAVSEGGDDDTIGAGTSQNNRHLFGPVVDLTPAPTQQKATPSVAASTRTLPSERPQQLRLSSGAITEDDNDGGTWYGASTVGGVSTVGASGGASSGDESSANGWDDGELLDSILSPKTRSVGDDDDDGSSITARQSHVVDHVPTTPGPRPMDASTAVAVDPSVASKERTDTIDEGSFGAVVDHTPSVRVPVALSVANSVATNATGLATDIKRDEEMDETTYNGGDTIGGDGWDHEEPELEELGDDDDQIPPLVDHVPERPESRHTDESTIVAGDPSEMFSQVDDLGHDETHFGPVVDLTPPSQLMTRTSTAESTVVNIASVAEDDLDVAVETAIDGPSTNQDQTGWQDTLPNPQSGNDEEENNEQLVDFVPVEQEEVPDIVRDASSEMATVGEKSTMVPQDEPKEDEFGPVVDHTPVGDASAAPSQVSEVEDRKPAARPTIPVDSIAPAASADSKEKGLDDDEYGPVVDQLPFSSKASFAPSRGGSTVDALATVSEVDDDYIAGEGWEEDVDIDGVGSPTTASRQEDRNLSVKWIDRLSKSDSAAFLQKNAATKSTAVGDSVYVDAVSTESAQLSLNETRYYDPEIGDTSSWASPRLAAKDDDVCDDDDDTPPSTPRSGHLFVDDDVIQSQAAAFATPSEGDCPACAGEQSSDCPCIRRLLAANKDGMLLATMRNPNGKIVHVNVEALLKSEMTKRRLVEKELQTLQAANAALKSKSDAVVQGMKQQMDVLHQLQSSNDARTSSLNTLTNDNVSLKADNERLLSMEKTLEQQLSTLAEEKRRLEESNLALSQEMDSMQTSATKQANEATSNAAARENELQSEVSQLKNSNEDLSHKIARLETECENLRGKNESLYEDLSTYQESMTRLEEQNAKLSSNESSLTAEIQNLKGSLQSQFAASRDSLQAQIGSLQSEVTTKSGECAKWKSQAEATQRKLSMAEAQCFQATKDLARMTKEKENVSSQYESRLSQARQEAEAAQQSKDAAMADLQSVLAKERSNLQQLQTEYSSLKAENQRNNLTEKKLLADKESELERAKSVARGSALKISSLEQELQKSQAQGAKQEQMWKQILQSKDEDLSNMSREQDGLRLGLENSNSTISTMQKQVDQLSAMKSAQEQKFSTMKKERDALSAELATAKTSLGEVAEELSRVQNELRSTHAEKSLTSEKLVSELQTEIQKLQRQLQLSDDRNESLKSDNVAVSKRLAASEKETYSLKSQLEATSELQGNLDNLEFEYAEQEQELNSLRTERDQLIIQLQSLEEKVTHQEGLLAGHTMSQPAMADLTREVEFLRSEVEKAKVGRERGVQTIQELQARISSVESTLASKEHTISVLEERLSLSVEESQAFESENTELVVKLQALEKQLQEHVMKTSTQMLQDNGVTGQPLADLQMKIDQLTFENDSLRQDIAALESENEEMLVQFGLLKEEMDEADANANSLQGQLDEKNLTVQRLEEKIRLVEEQLHLSDANGDTQQLVDELNSKNMVLSDELRTKLSENKELTMQIEALEQQLIEVGQKNEDVDTSELQALVDELNTQLLSREKSIGDLEDALSEADATKKQVENLQKHLQTIKAHLSEKERLIEQKDGAITDLQFKLENSGSSPAESAEVEALRTSILDLHQKAERDRQQLNVMEKVAEEATQKLSLKEQQLLTAEKLVAELRDCADAGKSVDIECSKLQAIIEEKDAVLAALKGEVTALSAESGELRSRLAMLQSELENARETLPTSEPSGQSSGETQHVQSSGLEKEVKLLHEELLSKDREISKLETRLGAVSSDLATRDRELAAAMDRLSVISASNHHEEPGREKLEEMRSHIVSLAKALENSESRRAEIIETLEKERKTNADGLRRLTESVKRFYSTLSLGDT